MGSGSILKILNIFDKKDGELESDGLGFLKIFQGGLMGYPWMICISYEVMLQGKTVIKI